MFWCCSSGTTRKACFYFLNFNSSIPWPWYKTVWVLNKLFGCPGFKKPLEIHLSLSLDLFTAVKYRSWLWLCAAPCCCHAVVSQCVRSALCLRVCTVALCIHLVALWLCASGRLWHMLLWDAAFSFVLCQTKTVTFAGFRFPGWKSSTVLTL